MSSTKGGGNFQKRKKRKSNGLRELSQSSLQRKNLPYCRAKNHDIHDAKRKISNFHEFGPGTLKK